MKLKTMLKCLDVELPLKYSLLDFSPPKIPCFVYSSPPPLFNIKNINSNIDIIKKITVCVCIHKWF